MKPLRPRSVALSALVLAGLAIAADGPKQTISARGLAFQAPTAWKSTPPATAMRLAQLAVEPVKPDTEGAELQVFAFPGGAGSVDANVKRWQSQFQDKDGKPPRVTTEKRKGKNVEVTLVEVGGRYVAPVSPGSDRRFDKPDYRMLVAIVETPRVAYFLKMVGPERTMKAARDDFDALISSISVEGQ